MSLLSKAIALDNLDPLAFKRQSFTLPPDMIYLDGNSLGALPKAASQRAAAVVDQQWGVDLIKSWNSHAWIDLPQQVGEKIAKLIGAAPGQVLCCDSISVNLFKLLCAALAVQKGRGNQRRVVLSVDDNFPTDLYMVQGLQGLLGEENCCLRLCAQANIEQALQDDVAVLLLTQVNFRSGRLLDMHKLTAAAHQKGILVIWDLAHSAGALPLALDACQVDFAVGCGYKYLNGGPGAPAFVYVATRHHGSMQQPLSGWMGHAQPFAFHVDYEKAPGIKQFLSGTPAIIAMSVLDAALEVFADVDMQVVRQKSLSLAEYCLQLVAEIPALSEMVMASPLNPHERGSQLAFAHPHAYAICQALIARGVICDFRAPDILRLGFTPLYTSHQDIYHAMQNLAEILQSQGYQQDEFKRVQQVT
ncbi:MAG: kynureninase [Paraglaciecola sp.]|nr:kynureninase [Paraglaciecola sp.]